MESGTSSAPIDNTAHNTTKQPEKQADHVQLKDHVTLLELADRRGGKELKRQTDAIKNIVQSYDSHSWNRYEGRHELLRKLAFRGRLEAIQLLLQPGRGADVNAPDGQGATALHEAAHGGHSHVVELLIAQGADVSIRTFGLGESALHYALRRTKLEGPFKGTPDTVALLLLHRADPNCLTKHYHHTPLHYAAMHRHDTSTKTLLEYGANILSRDNDGNLALHHAACKGHHEVVPLLLVKNKADTVDYLNHAGETPLYKAAHNIGKVENEVSPSVNYRETVKVLLAWNADIRLKIKGRSMVDWAESPDADPEIAGQILRKAREHQYQFRKTDEGGVIAEMTMLQSKALRESNCSLKAHVLSFYAGSELCPGSHHAECPISDLVYGDGLQQCLKQVKVERPEETPLFTWYHLPANHLEWIKHLCFRLWMEKKAEVAQISPAILKAYIDELPRKKFSGLEGLKTQFRHEKLFGQSRDVDSILISMPYLSLEAHCQQLKYSTNVRERHSIQTDVKVPTLAVLDYNRGTLAEEFPGSGLRQTLDQYYYVHLGDTRDRDSSQVLLRARGGEVISTDGDKAVLNKEMDRFRRQWWPEERESPEEPGGFDNCDADIIMVDQLWVFVIGQNTVISCFPQGWGEPSRNPLTKIMEALEGPTKFSIHSARDFAVLVLRLCSLGHALEDKSIASSFHLMVNQTAELQNKHFKSFIRSSRQVDRASKKTPDEQLELEKALDSFGIIEDEIKNLREVNDIIDELNIVGRVIHEQLDIIGRFKGHTNETYSEKAPIPSEVKQHQQQQRLLEEAVESEHDEMRKLLRQSRRTYDAILQLLDLKQKQVAITESRSTRQQAADTAKQGDTVLVFTVVTIIFLPASFMAAFFAVPNIEIPGVKWGIGFVVGIIILITLAFSVPLTVLAFNVNTVRSHLDARLSKRDVSDTSSTSRKTKVMESQDLTTGVRGIRLRNSTRNDEVQPSVINIDKMV